MLDNESTSIWAAGVLGRRPERVLEAIWWTLSEQRHNLSKSGPGPGPALRQLNMRSLRLFEFQSQP
jgi:hypothetical protein